MGSITVASPVPPQQLDGIIGKRFIYTYANGWVYELYVKNAKTIDYRIHSGMVGGRWVKNQEVFLVQTAPDAYKISWTEPTGTSVSLLIQPKARINHGVIFFPRWVQENPKVTVCFQNEHLNEMARRRETGPVYPIFVIDEFAKITFVEDCGPDNETVIDCAPDQLPEGFAIRTN